MGEILQPLWIRIGVIIDVHDNFATSGVQSDIAGVAEASVWEAD